MTVGQGSPSGVDEVIVAAHRVCVCFLKLLTDLRLGLACLSPQQATNSKSASRTVVNNAIAIVTFDPSLRLAFAEQPAQEPVSATFPTEQDKANYRARGGNDLVHETWNILRRLEPTWKESTTVAGGPPNGLTGTAWHYAKIVFKALFMNSPTKNSGGPTKLTPELRNSVDTLKIGASYHDADAIFLLAEMNFYGNFSHPRDFREAFKHYERLADLHANGTAQHMLGLMYATGIGAPNRDQARALLHHTFAAEQGNIQSEMTLAYRYHQGIGTGRDCRQAAERYKRVADKAMEWWLSGPPGGHHISRNAVRWTEYEGGAYGEGASFSSSGHNAHKDGTIVTSFDDVIEFLDMRQRQGDYTSMLALGKHYYEPPRGYRRNFRSAQKQFNNIAREYWAKDGKVKSKIPKGIEKNAGKAAAYLGRMFLRGEGVDQNFEKALTWFRRGVGNGDAYSQYHIGLMYRDGLGVPKDGSKAATYLKAAAEQNLAVAQSAVGVLFLDQGDVETAGRYFELAATSGLMEGFYYLAEMTNKGVGRERNCGLSVAYYKVVTEKAELIHSSFIEANSAFDRGDLDRAFVASLGAAEQGYENAQANVAYLLDQKSSVLKLPAVSLLTNPLAATSTNVKRSNLLTNPALALIYYTRSAQQSNIDSLLKMGDYYLSGIDQNSTVPVRSKAKTMNMSPENIIYRDFRKASTCYTTAAESHHSAQALWNLGWMHENGIGSVEQDFHIAKRYYDLALEMNKEAYLPVKLALLKLRIRSWWNGISGGNVKPIGSDDDIENRPKTFWEWLNRFLDAAEEMDAQEYAELVRQAREADEGLDGLAYGEAGMPGGDNDYYYEGGGGGGDDYLVDIDDGLIESLIIVALAGALALLVYARQQRQRETRERREREEREGGGNLPVGDAVPVTAADEHQQRHQQDQVDAQDRGLFPAPGEPDFANWIAGGVGH